MQDIPVGLYSFSFAQKSWGTHWPGQKAILEYIHEVVEQFNLRNIVLRTEVREASYADGIWTVRIRNLDTGVEAVKTCNIFITCAGGLREPSIPSFAASKNSGFDGAVFHSAQWDHKVDYKGKHVVLVGNGCSGAQIVPNMINDVASLTQVARSRQSYLPPPPLPSSWLWFWCARWIPGHAKEGASEVSVRAVHDRMPLPRKLIPRHIVQPASDALVPDFDIAAKRRVFDSGYLASMHNPKFNLIQDDAVVSLKGRTVTTAKGIEIEADIVVLSTGFKVQEYLFPLRVINQSGVELVKQLKETNAKMYRGTVASNFPNMFIIMGPNTATGHSSVIFTSEAQIIMTLKLIAPILKKLKTGEKLPSPAPSVEVTERAENEYYKELRVQMKDRVWEKDGGVVRLMPSTYSNAIERSSPSQSWYVDQKTRLCTALYPWSQNHFWYHATWPDRTHFAYKGL
ncbi:hypothetical protein P7C70_g5544, partial [Phenoliferia sp. Uapishka_3]